MIVQVRTFHLPLPDARFVFVMDQLKEPLQALRQFGQQPLRVDVTLEKTVQRTPQMRRGERLYRADVTVDVPGGTLRAAGQADAVQQAVVRMTHRLSERMRARPANPPNERAAEAGIPSSHGGERTPEGRT
jgi:ribosome-associated translation inhibitor RaiA